jgi:putative transposase
MAELKKTRRRLPHWELEGSVYFITFKTKTGMLTPEERDIVFNHIIEYNDRTYDLYAAVVMTDHVHIIIRPRTGNSLSFVMRKLKGVSARLINQHRNASGVVWRDESYDRIIRDEDEFEEKVRYVRENPVRLKLASSLGGYKWIYPDVQD